ncbi:hypothetical protein [Floridanema evergladense]|uniref:Uncharacterized protein n=1 Tax=Floridaenema evergladense BLCC-F167 TaxID=3153639 RepID=A0ABV4WSZ8_9CYAN
MFAQFRVRYPTGSLISELLTIYNGKFVVRALVQIDGVTKATGMAIADTIELAEDQARIRALELMGINLAWGHEAIDRSVSPEYSKPAVFGAEKPETPHLEPAIQEPTWSNHANLNSSFSERNTFSTGKVTTSSAKSHLEVTENTEENPKSPFTDRPTNRFVETPKLTPINSFVDESETPVTLSNVTPINSRRHEQEIAIASSSEFTPEIGDRSDNIEDTSPDDFSDLIARTNVQIKRLGWTKKQGSDHLLRTYGKKTRNDLKKEELEDFLEYLEAQPNPT